MKAILWNVVWIAILCATGFLIGSQVGNAGVPPVHCSTSTMHGTLKLSGVTIVIKQVKACSNGRVVLSGWSVKR